MKKKAFILSILFVFLLISCGPAYRIYVDDFRDNKAVVYEHSSLIAERGLDWRRADITYRRVIEEDHETFKIYFLLYSNVNSFALETTGYIRAGDQTFEVSFSDLTSDRRTLTSSKTKTTIEKDSTKTSTVNSVETSTSEQLIQKFVIETDGEMGDAIRKADQVSFRFYFRTDPATFILTKNQLAALKKMFEE
jgi:hypothetical protein